MKNIFDKSEKVILGLCLLGMVVCLYFLNNLEILNFGSLENLTQDSIGHIQKTRTDVRQKYKKEFSWQITSENAGLSEGDSLYTGPKSSCEILLHDGKKIVLSENTLLHFSKKNQKLSIDMEFGKVFTSGLNTPIVVLDCGEKYKIDPSSAAFELSKNGNCGSLDIDVKSGEIKVDTKKLSTQSKAFRKLVKPAASLAKNFQLPPTFFVKKVASSPILDSTLLQPIATKMPDGAVPEPPTAAAIPVPGGELAFPAPQFVTKSFQGILSTATKIKLRWTVVSDVQYYDLEIAEDIDFKTFKTVSVTTPQFNFKPKSTGPFYFRVKAKSASGAESAFSELASAELEFPTITLGQAKIISDYKAKNSVDQGVKKEFPVSWTEILSADKYVVEYDNNSDFSKAKKITVRQPASIIEVPKTGIYHYRVSAFNKQGRKISSTSQAGEIIYKNIFNMTAPRIDAGLKSIAFYFQKDFGQFIWLRWTKTVAEIDKLKYRIQISNSNQFSTVNYDLVTKENKFLINKNLTRGIYFWRVRAENSQQQSDWSDVGSIKIQTKANQ